MEPVVTVWCGTFIRLNEEYGGDAVVIIALPNTLSWVERIDGWYNPDGPTTLEEVLK